MDVIFDPLKFRNLTVKNRIFRSNVSGRFDNYDGSGNQARINWETKFARGGVGAIISSFVPITIRGRIVPRYATIHRDEHIPFWRAVGDSVHEYGCKFLMQLSHSGRQRDIGGLEYEKGLSSTDKSEPLHGFQCERMTTKDIQDTISDFAQAARRAREAGLDGVELHGANGYLLTQFLSPAINDRTDNYGGSLENRARFPIEVVKAIRAEVGDDFHVQYKISSTDYGNDVLPWESKGTKVEDSIKVCQWLEQAGADAIHVSSGNMFPHPRNPAGDLPMEMLANNYDTMLSSGSHTFRNYLIFKTWPLSRIFNRRWTKAHGGHIEGLNLPDSELIKKAVSVPVICTGGFQTASIIRDAINSGKCDGVSIARSLIANNDLVNMFEQGLDLPPKPCTYCNKCMAHALENPLGCYEESRFENREQMVEQIMSVFQPRQFEETKTP